jgi:hypothetical protein
MSGHPEFGADALICHSTFSHLPDLPYLLVRESVLGTVLAERGALFFSHIPHVVVECAGKQMVRVDAYPIVTPVEDR